MTSIDIYLMPKKIEIKSVLSSDDNSNNLNREARWSRLIYLTGSPKHSGTYQYTGFKLTKNDEKVELPKVFSIRISEHNTDFDFLNEEKKDRPKIGALYYFAALDDWEIGDRPEELHADISVTREQFENFVNLIQARKCKLVATVSFYGDSVDGALRTGVGGYDVTWHLEKSDKIDIKDFYISVSFENEIKPFGKMISKKLSILEKELSELKNKKISVF